MVMWETSYWDGNTGQHGTVRHHEIMYIRSNLYQQLNPLKTLHCNHTIASRCPTLPKYDSTSFESSAAAARRPV